MATCNINMNIIVRSDVEGKYIIYFFGEYSRSDNNNT